MVIDSSAVPSVQLSIINHQSSIINLFILFVSRSIGKSQ